jgi:hypothetical protein
MLTDPKPGARSQYCRRTPCARHHFADAEGVKAMITLVLLLDGAPRTERRAAGFVTGSQTCEQSLTLGSVASLGA